MNPYVGMELHHSADRNQKAVVVSVPSEPYWFSWNHGGIVEVRLCRKGSRSPFRMIPNCWVPCKPLIVEEEYV